MLNTIIFWITNMITGIDGHSTMNLDEFITWFTTMGKVRNGVHTALTVIAAICVGIIVITIVNEIVSYKKNRISKELRA